MRRLRFDAFVLLLVSSLGFTTSGVRLHAARGAGLQADPSRVDPSLVAGFRWRNIGPATTGGRVDDFAIARVPGSPDTIYVAAAAGGVFKSTNQGTSWSPVFDRVDAMMSIGDIAIAPSSPRIVWVGTGEANNRQSSSWGDGVYKSTDAGLTWMSAGLRDTRHIGRILVHPKNPDIVYVAAVGHLWGSNPERGVFRTSDGGATWKKVLFVDESTGATDIAMDPEYPDTIFAATYQRQRKAWGFNGGGPGSGVYRTTDGGETWTKLGHGLPPSDMGRIGLDIFQRNGRIVYAIVEAAAPDGGLYRSLDRGDTWEQLGRLNPRPMYYSQVRIDPKDERRVYLLGSNRGFYVSDDGGRSFRDLFSEVHSEDHALWIDPDDSNHLIVGGDGGVSISWDRGLTWLFRDNLPIGQFYEISADMRDPYVICGGLQDNGHWCVPSATRNRNGISNADAFNVGGGDGFYARIDPTDAGTLVIESQEGRAARVSLATLERQAIAPLPPERPKRGERDRWNWNTPVAMSSFDARVLYIGSSVVYRSADRGVTWKVISPDLTGAIDRDTLKMMGAEVGPRTLSRHDGQTSYSTLTTIGESPLDPKVLYSGSDDGQLHVTHDGGGKWTNVAGNIPGLPATTYVSSVIPSRHAAGRVYATFDGHFNDDYRAYVYVSEDYGQTWRSLAAGLPETSVHRLREHPRNPNLLVLGHERGLHVTIDRGARWIPFTNNMPNVPVHDILFHPRENDLIAGTHGRGIWVLDNISALEGLTPQVLASEASVMRGARGRLLSIYAPQAWFGGGQFFAPNPDFGAMITYYLRDEAPAAASRLDIIDAGGQVVRTLRGPARHGLNRAVWDLRIDPVGGASDGVAGANAGSGATLPGPLVLPGKYTVSVAVPGLAQAIQSEVVVEGDPRVDFSDMDRRARQTALLNLYDLQKTLGSARSAARKLNLQIGTIKRDNQIATEPTDRTSERVGQALRDIEQTLNTASALARAIEGYSGLPTFDQRRQLEWVFDDATKAVTELNALLRVDPPSLSPELSIAMPARRQ